MEFGAGIKGQFMLSDDSVFLNHGSYGAVPRCVHQRHIQYLDELVRNPYVWVNCTFPDLLKKSIERVSEFMGVNSEDTFLVQNATKAANTVIKSYPIQKGDAILITSFTYPAVAKTAFVKSEQCQDTEVLQMDMPFPIKCADDVVNLFDDFLSKHPNIKLACIDHITSATAIIMPVKKIVEVCHRYGVIVFIDGAHVPGQLRPDIQDIGADFYMGNFHKWVYTPHSCAFLWMNPNRKHSWLRPLITSYLEDEGLSNAFSFEGTKDDTPYISVIDGIDFFNSLGGIEAITDYTSDLRERSVSYLEQRFGVKRLDIPAEMVAPNMQVVHLPYLGVTSADPGRCVEMMKSLSKRFNIQVLFVTLGNEMVVRISINVYNTMDDVIKFAKCIEQLCNEARQHTKPKK